MPPESIHLLTEQSLWACSVPSPVPGTQRETDLDPSTGGEEGVAEEASHTGRMGGTAGSAGLRAPRRGLGEPGCNHVSDSDDLRASSWIRTPQGSRPSEAQPWNLPPLAELLSKGSTNGAQPACSGNPRFRRLIQRN